MGVSVKWLGHSSFEVRSASKIMYIDLQESSSVTEKADFILVTHSHFDHCNPSKIESARKKDTVIVAPKDCASKIGGKVTMLKTGDERAYGDIRIKAVEAYNFKRFRSPGIPYHPREFGVGYLITTNGKTIYHAGDTDFIPEMRGVGHVDVALLPSGGTYTMDNAEAADAALAIKPEIAVPMHRWDTNPQEFRRKVETDSDVTVLLLREGEEYNLK